MLTVTSYIAFNGNCRQAVEFYKSALDADLLFLQTFGESPMSGMAPADQIMHCTIKVGDSTIMMSDNSDPAPAAGGNNISLALGLNDPAEAQRLFDGLAEGGSIIMPLSKTFWAEAFGMVTDKFGVKWMVNCEAPSGDKAE